MSVEERGEAAIGTWRSGRGRRSAKQSPPDVPRLRRRPRHRLITSTLHHTPNRINGAAAARDFLACTSLLAPRRRSGAASELLRLRQVPSAAPSSRSRRPAAATALVLSIGKSLPSLFGTTQNNACIADGGARKAAVAGARPRHHAAGSLCTVCRCMRVCRPRACIDGCVCGVGKGRADAIGRERRD